MVPVSIIMAYYTVCSSKLHIMYRYCIINYLDLDAYDKIPVHKIIVDRPPHKEDV